MQCIKSSSKIWLLREQLHKEGSLLTAFIILLGIITPIAIAGTLVPCGWRGTQNLRCYEEMNRQFNYQPKEERSWLNGSIQGRRWCIVKGGQKLPANLGLSERGSLT